MDSRKVFKQASITSFFSQKQAARQSTGQEPLNVKNDTAPGLSSKQDQGRERKAPVPPTHDPFSGQGPTSSRSTVMADDDPSTSPQSSRVAKDAIDPASSISLGFSKDAGPSFSSPPAVLSLRPHVGSSPSFTPDKAIADHSGWSSPTHPSSPIPIPPQGSASDGVRTPTRNLFGHSDAASTASKRTAGMADFSPIKSRPPAKIPRTSPTPSLRTPGKASPSTSTPHLLSSPPSPSATKPALSRDAEIRGSDDEDDDMSDSSLPDIDAFVPSKRKPVDAVLVKTGNLTPERKGKSKAALKSPLPLHTKAKFDLKTLLDHQRRDDAMNAAFQKHEEAEAKAAEERRVLETNVVTNSPNAVRQQFIAMAGVQNETAGKALRAMERTETANSEQNFWYFFKSNHDLSKERPKPFPKAVAKGPWSLLAKEGTRRRHVESGFFTKIAARAKLPDEIYLWILDSIRFETSPVAREAYADLLASTTSANHQSTHVQRLITPECLGGVYRGLGAEDDIDDEQLRPVQEREHPYADRDWASLRVYLDWMGKIATHLEPESLQYAVTSLLRMAADPVLVRNPEVLLCHQCALVELVEAVDPGSWDNFVSVSRTCSMRT